MLVGFSTPTNLELSVPGAIALVELTGPMLQLPTGTS